MKENFNKDSFTQDKSNSINNTVYEKSNIKNAEDDKNKLENLPKNLMISSNIENEGNEDIYGSNST